MTTEHLATTAATNGLRDIRGLDAISFWPLAPGWWVVLTICLLLIGLATWYGFRWRQRRRAQAGTGWQCVARQTWQAIATQAQSPREQLTQSAELLRWIVIQRYGRETVAGLTGHAWLNWLQAHDPAGFAWTTEGRLLIEFAYQPPTAEPDNVAVQAIYAAVARWVETPDTKT